MKEKAYVAMSQSAVVNLVLGVVVLVMGMATGILLLVSGARLLKSKKGITF